MRIILVALMVALLAVPAQARGGRKGGGDQNQPQSADAKSKKARAEEKAANAAMKSLPDKPFDPWKTMRQ